MQEYRLDNPRSVELFDQAIGAFRLVEDERRLARTLTMASTVNRLYGHHTNALTYGTEAVTILEPNGPSLDLAAALSHRAFLEFIYSDQDRAVLSLVDQTISVATELGDDRAMAWALSTKAHLMFSRGDDGGPEHGALSNVDVADVVREINAADAPEPGTDNVGTSRLTRSSEGLKANALCVNLV